MLNEDVSLCVEQKYDMSIKLSFTRSTQRDTSYFDWNIV